VPKILKSRKDTIGLRIPDNVIARSLVRELGHPILSSSLPGGVIGDPEPKVEEYTDPDMIEDKFSNLVDIVVDGGIGGILPSTVVDCTGDEPMVIRRGLGPWEEIPQA
jgi:tRNA threonylcarbamoyl adenosine modification protein (Sua5/YciO/YrdC/YwlC family)